MQISVNANHCEPSPMRKFHPFAVEAKKQGKHIRHLNTGQPDLPTPEAFYEAVRDFDARTPEYEASPGMPVLIDAVRKGINEVRIAYVLKKEALERAMEILAKAIARYQRKVMGIDTQAVDKK